MQTEETMLYPTYLHKDSDSANSVTFPAAD